MTSRLALASLLPAVLAITLPSVASAQPGAYGPPPSQPAPQIRAQQRPAPKFALGLGLGHYWQEDERDGGEASLIGRLQLSPTFFIGAELAHVTFDDTGAADRLAAEVGVRMSRSRLARTYLTLGGGSMSFQQGETRTYLEVGAGLELPLGRHLALIGEARLASAEAAIEGANRDVSARWRGVLMVRF